MAAFCKSPQIRTTKQYLWFSTDMSKENEVRSTSIAMTLPKTGKNAYGFVGGTGKVFSPQMLSSKMSRKPPTRTRCSASRDGGIDLDSTTLSGSDTYKSISLFAYNAVRIDGLMNLPDQMPDARERKTWISGDRKAC